MAKKKVVHYDVKVNISSDRTGKKFSPGDTVTAKDFPAQVIENWLELGVLVEVEADEDE